MSKKLVPACRRYRLTLEYDGTGFSGWQKQNDARTLQGSLLVAAQEIFADKRVDIQGHGRTDAGVHALAYTAHLETCGAVIPLPMLLQRFNALLPASIVLLDISPCDARFHARHNCLGRSYLYQISKRKTAFHKKYVWWVKEELDTKAMTEAAKIFVGMHNFASFAEKKELKKTTKVNINGIFLYEDEAEEMLRLRVVGSHFLWRMVRRLAGVLVAVGQGKINRDQVAACLAGPSDIPKALTAPASGLFFEQAFYDQGKFDKFLAKAAEESL
ncbi:MAG: tRNA pseudouridine(38-40) synthase TruA [Candidatus Electrothrix sp.]